MWDGHARYLVYRRKSKAKQSTLRGVQNDYTERAQKVTWIYDAIAVNKGLPQLGHLGGWHRLSKTKGRTAVCVVDIVSTP